MRRLPSRQIHLDFHTSEYIPGIGEKFDKENFQQALKLGHVNSMTVFAKCHHGFCYYPTKVGTIHPHLDPNFDLTKAMMDACHEIGVFAPIYVTLGWSVYDEETHHEWRCKDKEGNYQTWHYDLNANENDEKPECSWVHLCPAGGYQQHLYDITEEIGERYDRVDGIFYDIVFMSDVCYCDSCVAGMKAMGLNPDNEEDALEYYTIKRKETMDGLRERLFAKHPEATVFFNSGGAEMTMPQWHYANTHFELEDLPTTWGGYDKMPIRAKYFSRKEKDYLGMTGKFHRAWGEFGGFKAPEAIKYECASLMTYGARISIGDQLHPSGLMDLETYRLIGEGFKYVEAIEDYCYDVEETANLGVMITKDPEINEGLAKLLLDSHFDFDIVHSIEDMERFKAIILPDEVTLEQEWARALKEFQAKGGSLLIMGESALDKDKKEFMLDIGASYRGHSEYDIDYVMADKLSDHIITAPFLFYESGSQVDVKDAEVLASIREPYFSRTYGHFCSHLNTPYQLEDADYPAAIKKGNTVYLAHKISKMYKEYGATFHRHYFTNALELVYDEPVVKVELPSAGRIRFVHQGKEDRYILHLLYASPIQRGVASIIEDTPTIYNTPIEVTVEQQVKRVYTAPDMKDIKFDQTNGKVTLTLPEFATHQIVVMEY
ncbi:alpha-amylase family protein [Vallitalea okinawensis]|uniref:alpha-amylase family protein n=1 Tax=Vallitalea okinawensis TaxID=2078660 RepID=UPI0013003488|nr:alpha-amylase family protein [Vallitalea okinawensis]